MIKTPRCFRNVINIGSFRKVCCFVHLRSIYKLRTNSNFAGFAELLMKASYFGNRSGIYTSLFAGAGELTCAKALRCLTDAFAPAEVYVYFPELVRRLLQLLHMLISKITSYNFTSPGERRAVTPAGTARVRRPEEWFSLRG
jgi:hypothetical protein